MAIEPINVFGRELDRAAVARRMRELTPRVELDTPRDDGWQSLTATFGPFWGRKKLIINYDPSYCSDPNWSLQMDGMHGYFSRFPETPRKARALTLTHTLKFALATHFRPEATGMQDPRMQALLAVAEALDAVLFTPSALLDARGRVLFGAGGAAVEDPAAEWPRAVFEVDFAAMMAQAAESDEDEDDYDPQATAPDAARVAVRALALATLIARAQLEDERRQRGTADRHKSLVSWAREVGAEAEMEEYEREVLLAPVGSLDPELQLYAGWRVEGLCVLLWALGRADIPPHDHEADTQALFAAAGVLDADAARDLLATPALRPREEIETLRKRLFALHWRITDFRIRRTAMDFAQFAATAWFGPLDISGLPLVEGDLAIGGKRVDRAPPEAFGKTQSIVHERHMAVNWLWEGPDLYSEADTST